MYCNVALRRVRIIFVPSSHLQFLLVFLSKKALLWPFIFARNAENIFMHSFPIFLPDFNQIMDFFWAVFYDISQF
jgi:hypothetical protein